MCSAYRMVCVVFGGGDGGGWQGEEEGEAWQLSERQGVGMGSDFANIRGTKETWPSHIGRGYPYIHVDMYMPSRAHK